MVVGIVIGSGVFFKAGKVLSFTNGNIGKTLAVVAIVGGIMIICSLVFATLAQKHEKVNGIVDYAEATLGKRYAYYVGWFMSTIYYPTLTSVLGWISASYTCSLFNIPSSTGAQLALAGVYLVAGFAVNSLSPRLAGRFQVSATFIKLIPLVLMGVVGLIVGLVNGKTIDAKSILAVMALAAKCGEEITITTDGPGEAVALDSLVSLVTSRFGEEE